MNKETDTKITGCIFQLGFLGFFLFMVWSTWDSFKTGYYGTGFACLAIVILMLVIGYNVLFEHDTPAEKEYYEINNIRGWYSARQADAIMQGDWEEVNRLKADEAAFEKTIEIHSIPGHNAALRYKRK